MDTTKQFKRQLPRNTFFQILSFLVDIGIGICLVPYLIHHLGTGAYGLIPIAGIMTQYVSLISQSIAGAVSRFLAVALQQNDEQDANRIFNTALFSYLALALLQAPAFVLIILYANSIFTIPQELYRDAILLLVCSATSFLVSQVSSVFAVPLYANNRLDISRAMDITRQVLRVAGIATLFIAFGPALRYVGYVDLILSVVCCAMTVVVGKWLAPVLRVGLRAYDWRKVRQLTAMGGWLMVDYLGFLLFLRIDIWICNRFISAQAAGEYAAVLQWSNLIRQAGGVLSGLTAPMIVIYYARSELERLIRLSQLSVRLFCLLVAIPISILCVFSSSILSLWLGESFAPLAPLMVIMLCHLTINVGILPLYSINTALNKVKWPSIVTCAMGVTNLILAIFLTKYLDWGMYGVAIAGAIVLTAKCALFTPVYAAIILRRSWYTFIRSSLSGLVLLAGLTGLGYVLNHYFRPESWVQLGGLSLTVGVLGLVGVWFALSRNDRQLLVELVPGRFRRLAAQFMSS